MDKETIGFHWRRKAGPGLEESGVYPLTHDSNLYDLQLVLDMEEFSVRWGDPLDIDPSDLPKLRGWVAERKAERSQLPVEECQRREAMDYLTSRFHPDWIIYDHSIDKSYRDTNILLVDKLGRTRVFDLSSDIEQLERLAGGDFFRSALTEEHRELIQNWIAERRLENVHFYLPDKVIGYVNCKMDSIGYLEALQEQADFYGVSKIDRAKLDFWIAERQKEDVKFDAADAAYGRMFEEEDRLRRLVETIDLCAGISDENDDSDPEFRNVADDDRDFEYFNFKDDYNAVSVSVEGGRLYTLDWMIMDQPRERWQDHHLRVIHRWLKLSEEEKSRPVKLDEFVRAQVVDRSLTVPYTVGYQHAALLLAMSEREEVQLEPGGRELLQSWLPSLQNEYLIDQARQDKAQNLDVVRTTVGYFEVEATKDCGLGLLRELSAKITNENMAITLDHRAKLNSWIKDLEREQSDRSRDPEHINFAGIKYTPSSPHLELKLLQHEAEVSHNGNTLRDHDKEKLHQWLSTTDKANRLLPSIKVGGRHYDPETSLVALLRLKEELEAATNREHLEPDQAKLLWTWIHRKELHGDDFYRRNRTKGTRQLLPEEPDRDPSPDDDLIP